jgi:hypothetical protein
MFPLLPIDIRLLIWESAFNPQIIPLLAEGYGKGEDKTALPHYIIQRWPRPDPNRQIDRNMWTGRFVPEHMPEQAIFQVSHESRHLTFTLGYRVWKMQKRGGLVRNMMWNPALDFVSFPKWSFVGMGNDTPPEVYPYHWLRMFAKQHPEEASVAQNLALYTSIWFRLWSITG